MSYFINIFLFITSIFLCTVGQFLGALSVSPLLQTCTEHKAQLYMMINPFLTVDLIYKLLSL